MIAFAKQRVADARHRSPAAVAGEFFALAADMFDRARAMVGRCPEGAPTSTTLTFRQMNHPRDNMDILLQDLRFAIRGLLRNPRSPSWPGCRSLSGSARTQRSSRWSTRGLIRPLAYPNPTAWSHLRCAGHAGSAGRRVPGLRRLARAEPNVR